MRRFSSTVRFGNTRRPSGTSVTPRETIWSVDLPSSGSPLKSDGAGLRLDKARDGFQCGGFARAVRADERDDLALLDGQVDALDGLDAAVGDDEVVDL